MEMKIIETKRRSYEGFNLYDVTIDELGLVLKGITSTEISILEEAKNTKYFVPLIETIRRNPQFDFKTFVMEMKLEDIESDKPSKILLSAQDAAESYVDGKEVFDTHSRILTREQADILKQCLAKNSNYNFLGANDWNHGFDIETFGLDFISELNHGLDEYTYKTLVEDEKLLNEIKNNPQVATYIAKAVNEYIKMKSGIEVARNNEGYDSYITEWWGDHNLDSLEGTTFERARQMSRRLSKEGKKFNDYNNYEEDIEDLQTLFKERLQQLADMPKDKIKMFEEYEGFRFEYYEDVDEWEVTINPETLVEGDAMEYLKTSGPVTPRIEVSDTNKAFVKKALKTANDLVIKQDEHGKDITYLQSMLQQRIEGPTNAGSSYENVTERELLENLLNADWEETSHPDVMEGCRVFKCNLPGLEGILDLDELDENAELYAIDPKGTGNVGIGAGNVTKKRAQETYLITGKEMIDGIEKDIVFTFHPGKPVKPSQVKAQKVADGTRLTVAKAKKLGLDKAKYLSEDMLQMYREKSEIEKPFFKKIFDKLKGVFNHNKKLPLASNESPSVHNPQGSTRKDFVEELKVTESELQKNGEMTNPKPIKPQELENSKENSR